MALPTDTSAQCRKAKFQARRLCGCGVWRFALGTQECSHAQEIVGEHSGADEKFEALSAFSQTTLHATEMRLSMPARKRCPFLKAGLFSMAARSGVFFPPRWGIQMSSTPACWQAVRVLGL